MQPNSGPPAGINMAPILAALQLRQQGHLGGGGTPLSQQVSMPTHSLPSGAPAGPLTPTPQLPNANAGSMPTQVQQGTGDQQTQNGALQAGQKAQGPMFDNETRDLAKSLVQKLLKGL